MRLPDWQHEFMRRLRVDGPPPACLTANNASGWAIYRASRVAKLVEALRDVYPVIERLVGAACFTALARRYLPGHPSLSADLHCYGGDFSAFLRGIDALADLPYLPDVARLEWRVHEAFHAADAPVLEAVQLAAVPATRWHRLRFRLHPSVRLMRSDFPVHRIWQVNQPDWTGEADVDLAEGSVALSVYRDDADIAVLPLDPPTFRLAESFQRGHGLARACDALSSAMPDADPGRALHALLHHGLVVAATT